MRASKKLFLITLLMIPATLSAQDDFRGFSVNPRMGIAYLSNYNMGVHAGAELYLYRNQHIYSVEYILLEEFIILGNAEYIINKAGFYYGKYWGHNWYRYQVQAGMGPVWGRKIISEQYASYYTVGAFLKAGAKLIPFKFAAIGADIQLNLNPEIPNIMLMVGIDIGKLINPD